MLSYIFQIDHPNILNDYIPSNTIMSDMAVIKRNIRNVQSTV